MFSPSEVFRYTGIFTSDTLGKAKNILINEVSSFSGVISSTGYSGRIIKDVLGSGKQVVPTIEEFRYIDKP